MITKTRSLLAAALLALVCVIAVMQSVRGVTFADPGLGEGRAKQLLSHDFRWFYAAGKAWLQGVSPHVPDRFNEVWSAHFGAPLAPFANPPTAVVITVPVALLPWDSAFHLYDAINIASYALILLFLLGIVRHHDPQPPPWRTALALALAASSSAVPGVIYAGQTSLVVAVGIAGMLYCTLKQRLWMAAAWMVLASIKPQLSLLPFIWLCVWRPGLLPRTAVIIGAVVAASFLLAWDPQFLGGILRSLEVYRTLPFNRLENSSVGLYRWFGAGPVGWIAPLCAVLATAWIAHRARAAAAPAALGIPMLLTALLMPIHPYDLTILMIPVCLLVAFSWSWWYVPAIVLVLRPLAVDKALAMVGWPPPEGALFYARWIALAVCLALMLQRLRMHPTGQRSSPS
jgi:hypothetical protein